jgi:X-X-X-Leu-X-X-Gly heptad repeat protein
MAKDAEINLKVNMEPQKAGAQELYKQLKAITEAGKQALEEMRRNAANISESVRDNLKEAKDTGNKEIYETVKSLFTENYSLAGSLDKQVDTSLKGFNTLERRGAAINQALEEGKINEEQAAYMLQVQLSKAKKGQKNVSEISNAVALTTRDLHESDAFMRMVYQYENFNEDQKKAAENARVVSKELHSQANALAELRDALDQNSKTYEQDSKQLLNRAQAAERGARNSDLIIEKLKRENEEISLLVASYKKGDKAADITEKIQKSRERVLALDNKIEASRASAEKTEQNVAAQEEKRTNAAEEQAKKRAEAAEKAAQKEAEAEQRRQAQAEKAAIKQQQLQEAEIYRTELLGKTKLELGQIIKQLNAEMKSAGATRDFEQLDALQQKMSIARSAMRNASMQANITRMTFMQQASTAGRLSNNISTLADGFGALSEGAKNGQLNLTGMASSLMDLWFTMKAGMGPIGWMAMGLEAVQRMLNNTALHEQNLKKIREESNNSIKEEIAAYEKMGEAIRRSKQQELLKKSVADVKDKYKELNTELQNGFNIIEKSLQAEKDKSLVIQGEQKHLVELQKIELKRRLISGEITQEAYDSEMLNIDSAAVIKAAQQEQENAEKDLEASRLKAEKSSDALDLAKAYYQNYTQDASVYGTSAETIKAREEYRATLLGNVEKAQKAAQDIIKKNKNKSWYSKLGEGAENIAALYQRGLGFGEISKKFDLNITMESERFLKELEEASRESSRAQQELFDFDEESRKLLKGKTEEQYLAEQAKANAKRDAAKAELDRVEEEDKNTQKAAKDAEERKKKADKNLADVQKREGELLSAKKKNLDAQIAKNKRDKEADNNAEKLSKKLEREARRFKEKSLEELEKLKTKAIKAQGTDEKAYQYRPYKSFIQQIDDIIYERKEIAGRIKQEAQAEVQSRAGSNKALAKYSKLLNKVDFKELSGVLDDGSISEPELKLLQREWVDAVKARNATAMAFIQKLIQDAAESKRQDEAIVGAINTTRKKMEKQAQRMQKKLKTTLK